MAVSISIGIKQNSRDIANNKSSVTVTVTANWTGGSHNSVISSDEKAQARGWVKIDGTKYDFYSTFNESETSSGSKIICEKIVDVSHNSDGSKTLNCSASYSTGVSSGTVTSSASKTLTAIPRKSTLSASDGTLGTTQTLTVSRQSTSFTHTITYKCGTASGTIVTKSSSTSISFTPPVSLAKQSTAGLNVSIVFTITTYNGDTSLGSATKTISCYIPDSSSTNPTVSLSVTDAMGYVSTYGYYIQNKSKFNIIVTASGKEGADIKSYETTINGKKYTSKEFITEVIPNSGSFTITTTVTDSRGRKAQTSKTVNVLAYSPPKITKISTYRSNSSGTSDESGSYITIKFSAEVSSLNGYNNATYSYKYRKANSGGSYTTVAVNSLSNVLKPTDYLLTFSADTNSSYEVIVYVTDNFGSINKSDTGKTVSKAWSMHRKGRGFAFGKFSEIMDALEVAWNLITHKDIYMGHYHDNEKNIFFKNKASNDGKNYTNDGVYPHNCRLYGGSAASSIGIGLYDGKNSKRIFAYNDHENYIETQVNIRQHIYQAYPSSTKALENTSWNIIPVRTLKNVTDLNPATSQTSLSNFFSLTSDGGIKCNVKGTVLISGQLFLFGLTNGDKVGAGIYRKNTTTGATPEYLTWTDLRQDSSEATINIAPIVVEVNYDDEIFLVGRNYTQSYAVSGNSYQTTRLIVQYVG